MSLAMYVRGCVDGAGFQVSAPRPAPKCPAVRHNTVVPPWPARTMFVATISMRTVAARVNLKWTVAESRNPSRFGLTVVSRRRSPANGAEPFVMLRSSSAGAGAASTLAAATAAPITWPSPRLQFPYVPLMQGTIEVSILKGDEAPPHLCRARWARRPGHSARPPLRDQRRHSVSPGRRREGRDLRAGRGDRQLREGL